MTEVSDDVLDETMTSIVSGEPLFERFNGIQIIVTHEWVYLGQVKN